VVWELSGSNEHYADVSCITHRIYVTMSSTALHDNNYYTVNNADVYIVILMM